MNEQTMRFRLGLFVAGSIVALGIIIASFQIYPSITLRHHEYKVRFKNASGVIKSTPVRRAGVQIGEVRKLELNDQSGVVEVTIWIYPTNGQIHPLYRSDVPTLIHGLLSGDTVIDFMPRQGGPPTEVVAYQPGDEIEGKTSSDVPTVIESLGPQAEDALKEINKTLKRYEAMAPLVEETLKQYRDLGKSAQESVPQLKELIKNANEVAKTVNELAPELKTTNREIYVAARNLGQAGERINNWLRDDPWKLEDTFKQLRDASEGLKRTSDQLVALLDNATIKNVQETVQNVARGTKNLEAIAQNVDALLTDSRKIAAQLNESMTRVINILDKVQEATKTLPEDSKAIIENLKNSTLEVNKLISELREALRVLGTGDGTVRRFLSDPALYNSLNETVMQAMHLLPRLERILKDVEVFADKIARHPESLGVGGAVRPSAGLKEGPSAWSQPHHGPDR